MANSASLGRRHFSKLSRTLFILAWEAMSKLKPGSMPGSATGSEKASGRYMLFKLNTINCSVVLPGKTCMLCLIADDCGLLKWVFVPRTKKHSRNIPKYPEFVNQPSCASFNVLFSKKSLELRIKAADLRLTNQSENQIFSSRSNAETSVSSFFAKQKRTTRWSKPSP